MKLLNKNHFLIILKAEWFSYWMYVMPVNTGIS